MGILVKEIVVPLPTYNVVLVLISLHSAGSCSSVYPLVSLRGSCLLRWTVCSAAQVFNKPFTWNTRQEEEPAIQLERGICQLNVSPGLRATVIGDRTGMAWQTNSWILLIPGHYDNMFAQWFNGK